jgi:thiol-disulfide isomerase/thioredoxin
MRSVLVLAPLIALAACNSSTKQASQPANQRAANTPKLGAAGAGTVAPSFSLARLDGKAVTSQSLKGKVVLIDLWASWCAPCVKSMPAIAELQKSYAGKGLVVLAVTVDDDAAKLNAFLARRPAGVTVVKPDAAFNRDYGTLLHLKSNRIVTPDHLIQANLPSWIVIDRRGRVAGIYKSSADEKQVLFQSAALANGSTTA